MKLHLHNVWKSPNQNDEARDKKKQPWTFAKELALLRGYNKINCFQMDQVNSLQIIEFRYEYLNLYIYTHVFQVQKLKTKKN